MKNNKHCCDTLDVILSDGRAHKRIAQIINFKESLEKAKRWGGSVYTKRSAMGVLVSCFACTNM